MGFQRCTPVPLKISCTWPKSSLVECSRTCTGGHDKPHTPLVNGFAVRGLPAGQFDFTRHTLLQLNGLAELASACTNSVIYICLKGLEPAPYDLSRFALERLADTAHPHADQLLDIEFLVGVQVRTISSKH